MITDETSSNDQCDEFQQESDVNHRKIALNDSLLGMEINPVKVHSLTQHFGVSYVKRKMKQIDDNLEKKRSTLKSQVATTRKVSNDSFL